MIDDLLPMLCLPLVAPPSSATGSGLRSKVASAAVAAAAAAAPNATEAGSIDVSLAPQVVVLSHWILKWQTI